MHPEVVEAILPFLQNPTGNPSSLHSYERMARSAVESARDEVASLLNCDSAAVTFTSGCTEANNLLLKGYVDHASRGSLVSSKIEHSSILEPLKQLRADGMEVILLDSNSDGQVDISAAKTVLGNADVQLMSIIYANNETGVIQPLPELTAMVDRERCLVHSDATQAIGKIPLDMSSLGIDAISFSAHKLRGPQGVGVLVVDRKPGNPLTSGGDQENKRRGGTENVAGIVGLGKAAALARLEMGQRQHYLTQLRDTFEARLTTIPGIDDNLALNATRVSFGMDNSMRDAELLSAKFHELVDKLPAVVRRAAV